MVVWDGRRKTRRRQSADIDGPPERARKRDEAASGPRTGCADDLDGRRRELVAAAGHELKTPLSIVVALCRRMLAAGDLDDALADDVRRIRSNAYVLLKRVDELLLAARLDSGRMELEPRDVDVAALVREISADFRSVAEARGQTLTVAAPAEAIATVDEEKLLSVVSNLVANALKFAPVDGIVRCSVSERRRRLRIEVADSGPGVPPGLRGEAFERYRQATGGAARPGGSGLGLAIVRELVILHGGTVTLSDAPEGGALFVVDLPRRQPQRQGAAERPPTGTAPAIPVTERQRATVERLRAELAAEDRRRDGVGARPSDAASGEAEGGSATALVVTADAELGAFVDELIAGRWRVTHAVDALQAARRVGRDAPDVVLLDAAAGAGAVRTLRERLGGAPVLALACDAEDVAALMHAGVEDCVITPFSSEELLARLATLSARARARATARREAALAGLDRAFDLAPSPMALISPDGAFLRVNLALCALLGHEESDLLTRGIAELTHPDDLGDGPGHGPLMVHEGAALARHERRLARADGSYVRARVSASLVDDDAGGPPRYLLWHIAEVSPGERAPGPADVVAGLPGRRAFERALRHQILRCERYAEQASLVRCTLDDLADVRRVHGADVADRLVQAIVEAVRRRLRDTDVVAFVGDHEVAALLAHADAEAAAIAAAGLREAAERQRVRARAGEVGTSAHVGIAAVAFAGTPGRAFLEAGIALEAARAEARRASRRRRAVGRRVPSPRGRDRRTAGR